MIISLVRYYLAIDPFLGPLYLLPTVHLQAQRREVGSHSGIDPESQHLLQGDCARTINDNSKLYMKSYINKYYTKSSKRSVLLSCHRFTILGWTGSGDAIQNTFAIFLFLFFIEMSRKPI